MGGKPSKKELVIATINYSGILLSPFEFYSNEYQKQESQLSKIFKTLLEQNNKDFSQKTFKWNLGKIDTKYQKQRYAPIYSKNVGIQIIKQKGIEHKKLMNQDTFKNKWHQIFETIKDKKQFSQQEILNCLKFDLHCYKTFIYYLYKIKDLNQAPKLNVQKYVQFMEKYFSKSFLNEKIKIQQTYAAMQKQNVDILFLQEVCEDLLVSFHKQTIFHVVLGKGKGSAILIRKSKFSQIHDQERTLTYLETGFRQSLNWNDDSVIAFVDNFILIGMHLSSKKEKNQPQITKMCEDMKKLKNAYPMCHVFVGGDANNFVDPKQTQNDFHSFPRSKDAITTMKKRTWIQPQVNKAEDLAADVKDVLFSTLPMINPRIVTILGMDSKKINFIPNQDHPCDHFVVAANIQVQYN